MLWRRKWQPTPVFLPGEFQGWWSQVGCIYGVAQSQTRLKRLSSSSSNQMRSLLLGCCCSNIFKWTGLGNIYIYIYIHTHIYITLSHIHIFISADIYTDINKYGFQLWIQLQNSIPGFILLFLSSYGYFSSLALRNLTSIILVLLTYLISPLHLNNLQSLPQLPPSSDYPASISTLCWVISS